MKDTIRRFGRIIKNKLTPAPKVKGPIPPMKKEGTIYLSPQAKSYKKAMEGATKAGGSSGVKVGP